MRAADGTKTTDPKRANAWEFFYHSAGYSYDPRTESPVVGRMLCALNLASAEQWADDVGATFDWSDDPDPAEYQDNAGKWRTAPAMICTMYLPCEECPHDVVEWCRHSLESHIAACLCSIIESDDPGERAAYRRVVSAELAAEARAAEGVQS